MHFSMCYLASQSTRQIMGPHLGIRSMMFTLLYIPYGIAANKNGIYVDLPTKDIEQ